MQATTQLNPRQKSCTECFRRKQKCTPGKSGSCYNCARRYPQVECVKKSTSTTDCQGSVSHSKSEPQPIGGSSRYSAISYRYVTRKASPSSDKTHASRPTNRNPASVSFKANLKSQSLSIVEPNSNSDFLHNTSKTPYGEPKGFGGNLATVNNSSSSLLQSSSRNVELFYLYLQRLLPNIASLDGQNTPRAFRKEIVPWVVQSPLMPEIAVLTSLSFEARLQGLEPAKYPKALAIRGRILSLLNQHLKHDHKNVYVEAIHAVIHLVQLEWNWGEHANMWAHMKGIKEMIRLQGGFENIKDPLLRKILILIDYQIAYCFERDLFLHRPGTYDKSASTIPFPYPESFNSPLLDFSSPFVKLWETLGLSLPVAKILDDMRLLTTSIMSLSLSGRFSGSFSKIDASKLQRTARFVHNRIRSLPVIDVTSSNDDIDFIYETCRIAAFAYSLSISSRIPFSQGYFRDDERRQDFYSKIWKVSLTRWKKISGIFLWILLVAFPRTGDTRRGLYLKTDMGVTAAYVTALSIAVEDFDVAVGCLRAIWTVQRWIMRQGADEEDLISNNITYGSLL
ncbi:hypothetical protein B0J14DRAFT_308034 [Halenospora varia]|nr:hypothetical protein B0J14DRAFT_308034 [Halenospora varia]